MIIKELKWSRKEQDAIEDRILKLSDYQIMELFGRVGLVYPENPLSEIIKSMRKDSSNLNTLLTEADSKENLLFWLEHFEGPNL